MAIPFNGRVSIPSNVLSRELDGESVILNLESESYFGLDQVGTRMLSVLTASESIQKAYEILLEEYDVDPEQLKKDLGNLIERLTEHGILEVSS